LAAAILALGGVSASATLFDPMTGSGTFAIEHALAARNVAPGLGRRFGFERWPDRGDHLTIWDALRREAQARALPSAPACIVARDVSRDALAAARRNADAAGVATDITFEVADVASPPPVGTPPGSCVINPPYGERLPSPEELNQRIGGAAQRWLQDGWRVAVLSGTPALERALPGRPRISHKLWNGALETRLLVYS
jgi:putative N6-adenine-specific DNA methylase